MGKLSGFEVREVNLSNVHSYLEKKTLDRINYSVEHAKLKVYAQSRADLIRLALIANHGGIYMDASFIALESLEWLLNIASYPSQFIFNRFGETPRVFMMWHPHYGSPLEWTIDQRHNTKAQWHLAYENNFIAAEKGSALVEEWF
jgi:mannosyltransferase OCH1-like enzyme